MIYEYRCSRCGTAFELLRRMDERDHPAVCPAAECGGTGRRILSLPAIHIDGSDPSWPTAGAKWERDRERRMAKERKNLDRHGTYK
jgi:putative FmdB family regulatory protein